MSAPAVEVSGLVKRYGSTVAVDGLDLRMERGSVLALLGPNGAGKTTTVEICEGFLKPDTGTVRVLGLDPVREAAAAAGPRRRDAAGRRRLPRCARRGDARLVAACAANPLDPAWLLDVLGLAAVRRTPYKRLSGGQQQRLSLACALVGRPGAGVPGRADGGHGPAGPPAGLGPGVGPAGATASACC